MRTFSKTSSMLLLGLAVTVGAVLGSTPLGQAAAESVRAVVPFAQNAGAVNGIKASRTPTAGRLLPLNANRRLPLSVLPPSTATGSRTVAARVYGSASQSVPATPAGSPPTLIRFNRASFDMGGFHDATRPTVLTVPQSGIYLLTAFVVWNPAGAHDGIHRAVSIIINGDHYIAVDHRSPGGSAMEQTVTTVYRLEKGNTVSVSYGHDSSSRTGPLAGRGGDDAFPSLTVYRLSA
jgi:hypothetical protein